MMSGVTIYNSAPPVEGLRQVPMAQILAQHRKRYVYHTSQGDLVLRHIRYVEIEEVSRDVFRADPSLQEALASVGPLFAKVQAKAELTPNEQDALMAANAKLLKLTHALAVKCFETPVLAGVPELEALIDALTQEERDHLYILFGSLVQTGEDANASVAMLAHEFGIPLTGDLTLETMTVDQVKALEGALQERAQAEERAFKGMVR